MLIEKDGTRNEDINALVVASGDRYILNKNQWLQVTPTGKRIELWQKTRLGQDVRVRYWLQKSVLAFFRVEEKQGGKEG